MTVPSTRFREDYAGNGSATSFPYAFRIFKATDLVVSKTDSSGNETTLTLGTDYTVTGAGRYSGGAVVLTTALPTGFRLTIERILAIKQETDLRNQGEFLAETHEDTFDRMTMIMQNMAGYLGMGQSGTMRTLLLGSTDIDGDGAFQARGNRIRDLADPVDDGDAATRGWALDSLKTYRLDNEEITTSGFLSGVPDWPSVPSATGGGNVSDAMNAQHSAALARSEKLREVNDDASLFGVMANGTTDDTAAFITKANNGVLMPRGTILLNNAEIFSGNVRGRGMMTRLKAKAGAASVLRLGAYAIPTLWAPRKITELIVDGNSKAADGIVISDSAASYLAGRWTIDTVAITQCNRGFYKPVGNIGNRLRDIGISECNYGYYSVGQAIPLMHAGNDLIHGGEITSCAKAAIYIDSPQAGTGGTTFRDLVLEGNPGFGAFVKNWADSYTPLTFDNVWQEVNATAAAVDIDGTSYTPRDMRLENAAYVVIKNGMMPKSLDMINSRLIISDATINDGPSCIYNIDSLSTIIAERLSIDGGVHPFTVNSLIRARRIAGNQAQVHWAPPRTLRAGSPANNSLQSIPFDGAGPFVFTGLPGSINGTSVADGRIFSTCCEIEIPNGYELNQPVVNTVTGYWYVVTFDARLISGSKENLNISITGSSPLAAGFDKLLTSSWRTMASVAQCGPSISAGLYIKNMTGGPVKLRLSALQIAHFYRERDALEYYNFGTYFK